MTCLAFVLLIKLIHQYPLSLTHSTVETVVTHDTHTTCVQLEIGTFDIDTLRAIVEANPLTRGQAVKLIRKEKSGRGRENVVDFLAAHATGIKRSKRKSPRTRPKDKRPRIDASARHKGQKLRQNQSDKSVTQTGVKRGINPENIQTIAAAPTENTTDAMSTRPALFDDEVGICSLAVGFSSH